MVCTSCGKFISNNVLSGLCPSCMSNKKDPTREEIDERATEIRQSWLGKMIKTKLSRFKFMPRIYKHPRVK